MNEGELHIWRYTLNEQDYYNEKSAPLLSKQEHERCNAYMREAEKIRYICNHRFVRNVLANYLNSAPKEIEFNQAAMGKPFIKNSGLFFNYSYRGNLGLLAISKHNEIGVDIEKIKLLQDGPTFISFSFSEKEKEIIYNSAPGNFEDTLFTFWTFKEAIIKALGVGLNADLTQIDLSGFLNSELCPLSFDSNNLYTIKKLQAMVGYKAACAIKGKVNSFKEFEYCENSNN